MTPVNITPPDGSWQRNRTFLRRLSIMAVSIFAVMLLYTALLGCFTYPLSTSIGSLMDSRVAYVNEDVIIPVWYWWHITSNLRHSSSGSVFLWETNHLYYPDGLNIQKTMCNPLTLIGLYPLIGLYGFPYDANLYVYIILLLNGVFMYVTLKYLKRGTAAALLGGALVALNPFFYSIASSGRHEQATIWFVPLAMALVPAALTKGRRSTYIGAVCLFVLTGITYWFLGLFLLLYLVMAAVYYSFRAARGVRLLPLRRALVIGLLFLSLSLPLLQPYLNIGAKEGGVMGIKMPSIVPLRLPTVRQGEIDDRLSPVTEQDEQFTLMSESPVTILRNPVAVFQLLLMVPLLFFRKRPTLWFLTAAFFYLLSLGPYLTIPGLGIRLIMPFSLLYACVPFFSRIIGTDRFSAVTFCATALLSAYSFTALSRRFTMSRKLKATVLATALITIVILARSSGLLFIRTAPAIPPGIHQLKGQTGAVINIPFFSQIVGLKGMFYQTAHELPMMGGPGANIWYLSTKPFNDRVSRNPLLSFLMDFGLAPPDKFTPKPAHIRELTREGFRFIIYHKISPEIRPGDKFQFQGPREPDPREMKARQQRLTAQLSTILGCSPMYSDEEIDIFDLNESASGLKHD